MEEILINKECNKCKIPKPINEFSLFNGKHISSWCKKCMAENSKLYYQNNKEKQIKYQLQYQKENSDKLNLYKKERYNKNKEKMTEWYRNYNNKNREKIRENKRRWDRKAMLDPLHRLSNNIRGGMHHALKAKKGFRKWETLVGYTLQDLINHISPRLEGTTMTWENYGSVWHIDHITPKSWFQYENTDDPKFKECWALSNLQPKLKLDNIRKGNRSVG